MIPPPEDRILNYYEEHYAKPQIDLGALALVVFIGALMWAFIVVGIMHAAARIAAHFK